MFLPPHHTHLVVLRSINRESSMLNKDSATSGRAVKQSKE